MIKTKQNLLGWVESWERIDRRSWSVSQRCHKWQKFPSSITYLPNSTEQESLNKYLETGSMSSVWHLCLFVISLWACSEPFPVCFWYTPMNENRDTMWSSHLLVSGKQKVAYVHRMTKEGFFFVCFCHSKLTKTLTVIKAEINKRN